MFTSALMPLRSPSGRFVEADLDEERFAVAVRVGQDLEDVALKNLFAERVEADRGDAAAPRPALTRPTSASSTETSRIRLFVSPTLKSVWLTVTTSPSSTVFASTTPSSGARTSVSETRDARVSTFAAARAAFAFRSIRSARCCASFAASCASSWSTFALMRSSSATATLPELTSAFVRERSLFAAASSASSALDWALSAAICGASVAACALAAERSALPRLRSNDDSGVVDAREQIPAFDRGALLDEDLGDAAARLRLDLHALLGLDGAGRVDGVDRLAADDGRRDDGHGPKARGDDRGRAAEDDDDPDDETKPEAGKPGTRADGGGHEAAS